MSSTYLGTVNLQLDIEQTFDPRYGYATRITFGGPMASLSALNATYIAAGNRTNITQARGKSYLQVFFAVPDPAAVETPTDYYELETEFVQEGIWKSHSLEILARGGGTAAEGLSELARWRREIQSAMKGRLLDSLGEETSKVEGPLDPEVFVAGNLKNVYQLVLRDGDTYETTRQVLTRVRTISIAYSAPAVAQAEPKVYLTSTLVSTFGIPSAVAAKLPTDPTDVPTNATWGWKQRRNTSRYEWSGRVSEVMSWTFAAWSTLTHTIV